MTAGHISYALIANGTTVLTEYCIAKGNFAVVACQLLRKINCKDTEKSYLHGSDQVFHYLVASKITFLCLADVSMNKKLVFSFLHNLKEKFISKYGLRAQKLIAYSADSDFKPVLQNEVEVANHQSENAKIENIHNTVKEIEQNLYININKILERGERIDLLVEKSQNLDSQANMFMRNAGTLRKSWWKRKRNITLFCILILLVLAYVLAAIECGIVF